jgi:hypothetical protein
MLDPFEDEDDDDPSVDPTRSLAPSASEDRLDGTINISKYHLAVLSVQAILTHNIYIYSDSDNQSSMDAMFHISISIYYV